MKHMIVLNLQHGAESGSTLDHSEELLGFLEAVCSDTTAPSLPDEELERLQKRSTEILDLARVKQQLGAPNSSKIIGFDSGRRDLEWGNGLSDPFDTAVS